MTKAEYLVALEATKEAVWIKEFITELGVIPSISETSGIVVRQQWSHGSGVGTTNPNILSVDFTRYVISSLEEM